MLCLQGALPGGSAESNLDTSNDIDIDQYPYRTVNQGETSPTKQSIAEDALVSTRQRSTSA